MNIVESVVRASVRRPAVVFICVGLLLLASLLSVQSLGLKTSNLDLIDQNAPAVKRFLSFARSFGTPNALVVVLEGDNPAQLQQVADEAAPLLREVPGVRKVLDKFPKFELAPPTTEVSEPEYQYLQADNSKALYIFVQPENVSTEVSVITPLVAEIERTLDESIGKIDGVRIGYTGIPRYSLDDQQVIQRDMSILSLLSLALVSLLFVFSFHSIRRPILSVVTLLVSVILTFGVVAQYPGHLTLLSAPFAMMIFGLGIDYGIHIINRVEENLAKGWAESRAVESAVIELARTLSTSCGTTVAVFFVLMLSSFLGFKELGFIAGIGLLICLLLMFTLLPAMLASFVGKKNAISTRADALTRFVIALQGRRAATLLFLLTLLIAFMPTPRFDSDYLNLQPSGSNSVRLEREMTAHSVYSPYFAAFVVDSVDEAASLAGLLRSYDEIGEVRSLSDFISLPNLSEDEVRELMKKPREEWPSLDSAEIPERYQGIFDSKDGKFAVYAYPSGNIWDPDVEDRFLRLVRSIDEEVTGMPLLGNEMIRRTKQALHETSVYAFVALLLILGLDFKRPLLVLLTAVPPVFAIIWMHALMRLGGVAYNPLNIMALPIVLGIAVDDSVHITHRFLSEKGNLSRTLRCSGRSVLLTTLTTLAAFACIAFAEHRGLRSFSLILSIGVTAAFFHSVTVLPWLLNRFRGFIFKGNVAERHHRPSSAQNGA